MSVHVAVFTNGRLVLPDRVLDDGMVIASRGRIGSAGKSQGPMTHAKV